MIDKRCALLIACLFLYVEYSYSYTIELPERKNIIKGGKSPLRFTHQGDWVQSKSNQADTLFTNNNGYSKVFKLITSLQKLLDLQKGNMETYISDRSMNSDMAKVGEAGFVKRSSIAYMFEAAPTINSFVEEAEVYGLLEELAPSSEAIDVRGNVRERSKKSRPNRASLYCDSGRHILAGALCMHVGKK